MMDSGGGAAFNNPSSGKSNVLIIGEVFFDIKKIILSSRVILFKQFQVTKTI